MIDDENDMTTEELEHLFDIEIDKPRLSEDQLAIKKVFGFSDRELLELAIGKDSMIRIARMLSNLETPPSRMTEDQKLVKKFFHNAPVLKTPKKRKSKEPNDAAYWRKKYYSLLNSKR